ncbi:MAG: hypothetical protein V4640_00935 [Verrucomicrobiota bacterium]
MFSWIQSIFAKSKVPCSGKADFDTECVRYHHPQGDLQQIRWDDLDEVGIVTTDEGPFVEDVFFMLLSEDREGCAIPQSAEGMDALLARLQALPEFDSNAVIEAMGCTSNNNFVLWKNSKKHNKTAHTTAGNAPV